MKKVRFSHTLLWLIIVTSAMAPFDLPVAGSCAIPSGTPQEIRGRATAADEVFTGVIVSQEVSDWQDRTFPLEYILKIRVGKIWKGARTRSKYVVSSGNWNADSRQEHIFHIHQFNGVMNTNSCDGIIGYSPQSFDPELTAILGQPALAQAIWPEGPTPFRQKHTWLLAVTEILGVCGFAGLGYWFLKFWRAA